MHIAAITGFSGAGKTTLIAALIQRYAAEGRRVAVIKHTHHELNTDRRGDTARFLDCGAEPVFLAGKHRAVVFHATGPAEWTDYVTLDDLVSSIDADILLIEGLKTHPAWPQVLIEAECRPTVDELAGILDRIWRP
jgi:molybdopterin-guanine dinucleotide biosynthesis protein MobB